MAAMKKGMLVPAAQWWQHLRDWKREFWGRERTAQRRDIDERLEDADADTEHRPSAEVRPASDRH